MCGIFAYAGYEDSSDIILQGLKNLEYRGYDSAGVSLFKDGFLKNIKSLGKVDLLVSEVNKEKNTSFQPIGIGHTRWATHGEPNLSNAHPQIAKDGDLSVHVVHNGIIENYQSIKNSLIEQGFSFVSSTDTEVVPQLFLQMRKKGLSNLNSLQQVLEIINGSFALAILVSDEPDKIYFAKKNMPLLIGKSNEAYLLSSDMAAFNKIADEAYDLQDGDFGFISKSKVYLSSVLNNAEKETEFAFKKCLFVDESLNKGDFDHYMIKEIYEQPASLKRLFLEHIDGSLVNLKSFTLDLEKIKEARSIHIVACGSAYLAGKIVKNSIEDLTKLVCTVEIASEYRYKNSIIDKNTLVIAVSQSGETADTIAALSKAKDMGAICMSICNAPYSTIARMCESLAGNFLINAGIEVSVASTKAFTNQVASLKILAVLLAKINDKINIETEKNLISSLLSLPSQMQKALAKIASDCQKIAKKLHDKDRILLIGRGEMYGVALEGALKMKELAYIFAEGYAAGELKHGPLAIVDENMPVIVLFSDDQLSLKTFSNMQEVMARGAQIIGVASENFNLGLDSFDDCILIPCIDNFAESIIAILPLQFLAYYIAKNRGYNVDMPKNLAKSVTVE